MLVAALSARATDLTQIDRRVAREPAYTTSSPRYCLLVFGPEAKTHVWLVRDGDVLYVDRKANGDLTDPADKVAGQGGGFNVGNLADTDGQALCTDFEVHVQADGTAWLHLTGKDNLEQFAGWARMERPQFADKAADAPVIHFGGPLTLGQYGPRQTLLRSIEGKSMRAASLRLMIGTPGLGKGTFASYDCDCCEDKGPLIADAVYPAAQPGEEPIKRHDQYERSG